MLTRIAFLAVLTALAVCAQPAPLAVAPLGGGVYWVKGGAGSNTGFIVGRSDVAVIDAKMTEDTAKAWLAEIAKVTPKPVRRILLTHSDGDHVNGLVGFPKDIPIVAHANCKRELEEAWRDPKFDALKPYLPGVAFTTPAHHADIDGVRIGLIHNGPAHTSGDVIVFLPDQKIAFVGDLVFLGRDPLIHTQKGGTSIGLVATLKRMLELNAETFVSGHADPVTKAEIRTLLASIEEKQAKIKAMVEAGKSAADVRTAFNVTATTPPPGGMRRLSFIEVIYRDMGGKIE